MFFGLSFGVQKISIKGFHIRVIGGKSLAFFNDLSIKRVLDTDELLKYECQLFGEARAHVASLYVHLQKMGDSLPRYNIFAEVTNRVKMNQQLYLRQAPEARKEIDD